VSKGWRVMGVAIAAVAACYALVCLAVYLLQARMIWFPGPPPDTTPAASGLAFDEWKLPTQDGALIHAWRVRAATPRGAVVLCHGNAGNIASRIEKAHAFVSGGFDVVLFDYRGYGLSTGEPSEEGTYLDAEAAWTKLVESGVAPERIVAFGESLGGAVAVELARRRRVGAVVVEDTFTSLTDMAGRVYPWLPTRLLLRTRYASADKIGALDVPVMVIHSRDDELVPFAQGRALYDAAREPKQFVETRGSHNGPGFVGDAPARAQVAAFLAAHVAR
jgi:fermentation-respiration switch protein FrsA (DUF1100 family)